MGTVLSCFDSAFADPVWIIFCQSRQLHCIPAGGIIIGIVSDCLNARAMSCVVMLLLAVPSVSVNFILCECQFHMLTSTVRVHFLSSSVICQYFCKYIFILSPHCLIVGTYQHN